MRSTPASCARSIRATACTTWRPHGFAGFTVLGAVFLCATGAEALYADMGHFGARPIRLGWYGIVLPMLVLNYAGQAALVVASGRPASGNPFFLLGPAWLQLPLVVLATAATIIASQAIISGVFSMTRQAIQLGLCPRLTGHPDLGRGLRTDLRGRQLAADGLHHRPDPGLRFLRPPGRGLRRGRVADHAADDAAAVQADARAVAMVAAAAVGRRRPLALVDLSFVAANLTKVAEGGWVPLVAATCIFAADGVLAHRPRGPMLAQLERGTMPLAQFIETMAREAKVAGTAVYLSRRDDVVPLAMLHNVKHYHVLHERNVMLHVETEHVPRVAAAQRVRRRHWARASIGSSCTTDSCSSPTSRRCSSTSTVDGRGLRLHADELLPVARYRRCVAADPRTQTLARRSALRLDAAQCRRRHRILPHPAQPHRRARRAHRTVAGAAARGDEHEHLERAPKDLRPGHAGHRRGRRGGRGPGARRGRRRSGRTRPAPSLLPGKFVELGQRRMATAAAAPHEMPERMPSSRAKRREDSMASSSETCSTRSTTERSRVSGMKPAPMPWILCGPGFSCSRRVLGDDRALFRLDRHGQNLLALGVLDVARNPGDGAAGADARHQHVDLAVGVVPDFRPGGLLVDRGVGRVLELLRKEVTFGIGCGDLLRPRMAPFIPSAPGVRIRLAPKAASTRLRSMLMVSGMVSVSL